MLRELEVLGTDGYVRAVSVMGARRPDIDVETRVVSIFHFRDGRQVERWFFPEDAAIWDRILEDPPTMGA
jgi:ketosteroid isomerase-like protein